MADYKQTELDLNIGKDDSNSNPAESLLIPQQPKNRLYTHRGGIRYGIPPEERVNGMKWS